MARPPPADSPAKAMSDGAVPLPQEGLVGRESVVDRRRVGVFGGEPVVDGDDLGARPPADLRGQAAAGRRPP